MICINFIHFFVSTDETTNKTVPEGTVRLVGGSGPHDGRVETYYFGYWASVCVYSHRRYPDNAMITAKVICRQLGYSAALSTGSTWTRRDNPFHLGDVLCHGSESNLTQCRSQTVLLPCRYPAIVTCRG